MARLHFWWAGPLGLMLVVMMACGGMGLADAVLHQDPVGVAVMVVACTGFVALTRYQLACSAWSTAETR